VRSGSAATDHPTVDVALDVTVDTVLRGLVTLVQPVRGLRSSLDPILLATFLRPPFGRFVDIGCGAGALGFSLAALDDGATGVMVEIQPRLAALAEAGRGRNPFAARLQIVQADVRRSIGPAPLVLGTFDLVVTNPPFRALAGGVLSPDPERAQANHEVTLALDEWLDAAAALRAPAGRIAVVYPAERLADLERGLKARGLTPRRLRLCAPNAARTPTRVLLEAGVAAAGGPVVEPPLVLHETGGGFTAEVRRLLGDGNPSLRDPQLARS
jgi:tRNA1Val (adenine37-N6)-methyltransferase